MLPTWKLSTPHWRVNFLKFSISTNYRIFKRLIVGIFTFSRTFTSQASQLIRFARKKAVKPSEESVVAIQQESKIY